MKIPDQKQKWCWPAQPVARPHALCAVSASLTTPSAHCEIGRGLFCYLSCCVVHFIRLRRENERGAMFRADSGRCASARVGCRHAFSVLSRATTARTIRAVFRLFLKIASDVRFGRDVVDTLQKGDGYIGFERPVVVGWFLNHPGRAGGPFRAVLVFLLAFPTTTKKLCLYSERPRAVRSWVRHTPANQNNKWA